MTLTLTQARTVVADHLDDANNYRWSTTQIDTALKYALNSCLNDYAAAGGDRFDKVADITSTSGGLVEMTALDPLVIKGVSILIGNRYWPIKPTRYEDKNIVDTTARSVQVRYIPSYSLPSTTSHPLVGSGATAANSFDAFDHWICARAAEFCAIKDDELRQALRRLADEAQASCMMQAKIPGSIDFPMRMPFYSQWFGWVWNAGDKDMYLVRK